MPNSGLLSEINLPDITATQEFAARFAPSLQPGDVVAFDGALGAGKTALCRAIIQALGYEGDVPSPTFNLLQIYDVPRPHLIIWHLDLYRLEQPEDIFEIGIEEGFEVAVCLIEWPSRIGPYLPKNFLTFRLDIMADGPARKLTIFGDEIWRTRLKDTHITCQDG